MVLLISSISIILIVLSNLLAKYFKANFLYVVGALIFIITLAVLYYVFASLEEYIIYSIILLFLELLIIIFLGRGGDALWVLYPLSI